MKRIGLLTWILILTSGLAYAQSHNIVLKTDFNGTVSFGSIDSLILKIQEGKEVRIGWQLDFDGDGISDLDHWIDANFISILNGHVFNQIDPIYRQIPKKEIPQVNIINSNMQWSGIIGTNGKLISRSIIPELNLIEDKLMSESLEKQTVIKEKIVATIWAVKE